MERSFKKPFPLKLLLVIIFLAILFSSTETASGAVWIVDDDGGPGVDFTDIPPAVSAAAPGDLILVRDGGYSGFYLDKALTLAADTGHQPLVNNMITVGHIAKGKSAVIAGFDIYGLHILNSTGSVIIDHCDNYSSHHYPAIRIENCGQVTVSRCILEKWGEGFELPTVQVKNAKAIISQCSFIGQDGAGNLGTYDAYDGGAGLYAWNSDVYFQSSSACGGFGGYCLNYGDPGDGGPGIDLDDSLLHLFGTEIHVIEGGRRGWSNFGTYGENASAVAASSSTVAYSGVTFVTYLGKPYFNYDPSSTITEVTPDVPLVALAGSGQLGDYIQPILSGLPGSAFALFFSPLQDVIPLGKKYSHLLLDPGHLFYFAGGIIDPGPPPSYLIPLPPAVPDLQGIPVHFQAYVVTSTGLPYLSTSASFVLR